MKKLSHRQLVLISSVAWLIYPAYYWIQDWTGVQNGYLYWAFVCCHICIYLLTRKAEEQMDEYAERAMLRAKSICYDISFVVLLVLPNIFNMKAAQLTIRLVGLYILTFVCGLITLRGLIFYVYDKQGMD